MAVPSCRIALDAMGGDNAPTEVVQGALLAVEEYPDVEITEKEELDVEFYSDRVIPLRDVALEQIQLSIPMKPLCDEGCLGLCPTCGVNRTRESCSCETAIVDDRWGTLKDIRDELLKKKNI